MIGPSISYWSKNGASHRVFFDTPPLEGLRLLPIDSKREHTQDKSVTRNAVSNGNHGNRSMMLNLEKDHGLKSSVQQH